MDLTAFFALPAAKIITDLTEGLFQRYAGRGRLGNILSGGGSEPEIKALLKDGIEKLILNGEFAVDEKTLTKKAVEALLDKLENAVELFQVGSGGLVDLTKLLDDQTIKRLGSRIGCGATDRLDPIPGPALPMDPNSPQRHVILYFIKSLPQLGPTGTFDDALRPLVLAFESWYQFLNLDIAETFDESNANLLISCEPLRGRPATDIALTDVGPPNGRKLRMVFDSTERSWDATMLQACAAHELGHALGIRHADVRTRGQLMNDTLDMNIIIPQAVDIQLAQAKWGVRRASGIAGAVTRPPVA